MKRIVIGIFLLALAAPGLAQTEKLGIGDAVRITVFQHPDLTTDARITERGTIALPLVGEVKRLRELATIEYLGDFKRGN